MNPVVSSLLAFSAAALVLTVTPGVDTAVVLRSAAGAGRRSGAAAALGVAMGCLAWGLLAAAGLAALLAASARAYDALRLLGAAYLAWLGLRLLLRPGRSFAQAAPRADAVHAPRGSAPGAASDGLRGLLTNLLNPKVGVFYVSFLPQFVPHGVWVGGFLFLLACVHVVLSLAWFAVLIAATAPIGRWLSSRRVARALDRCTGLVFLAFGARLAAG
ncbi:LysE family translocator [Thiomonas sp. FB-6]|uniref:LysE family translocator n=1 Tax=Thiomonas sp. FB-6 TaxID=1158291 RepID=UPI0003762B09|nr:LysE family translocator [Thiomonas sp. FB-6]